MANWIISSSILIFVIIILRFLLKGKISLRLQYGLWVLVLLRLLLPFSIGETVISIGSWLEKQADTIEGQQITEFTESGLPTMSYEAAYDVVADKYAHQGVDIETIPEDEFAETIDDEIMETMTKDGKSPTEIAGYIWMLGSCVLAFGFIFSNLHFSNKLEKNRKLLAEEVHKLFPKEIVVKGGGRLPVYISDMVDTPCLYGFLNPAIYVTTEAMESKKSLRHVLEHERTHYIHKDHIWSVLRVVCLMIHWYNPLVWCAVILSKNDAELACDEATILRLGEKERAAYGRTLIGLTCEKRPTVLLTATTMTGSGKSIRERIRLIAKKPKMAVFTFVVVITLAVVAAVVTFTGAKEQYDSFEEWASTLEPKELHLVVMGKDHYGEEQLFYVLQEEEYDQFCELLQSISEEQCFRKKQTVGEYEEYYLHFLGEGAEMSFKCLEDGTILVRYHSEMPNFAGEGTDSIDLIIDSDKLWNYIVDTVDEKGWSQNFAETPSTETDSAEEQGVLIGTMDENSVQNTTPVIEIGNIFARTDSAYMTLYSVNNGELNRYEIGASGYESRRLPNIFSGYEWTRVENPDVSSSEYWISVESTDKTEKMTFYDVGEGIIECTWNTGYKIYWQGTKKEDTGSALSFFFSVRHLIDNLEVHYLDIVFACDGDVEDAAYMFAYDIYGAHHMNLSAGNSYGFSDYEVMEFEIEEISEDATKVTAWVTYAFVPWDMDSLSIWAGNTDYATGEYEGKLMAQSKFTLEKMDNGRWRCKGIGTG